VVDQNLVMWLGYQLMRAKLHRLLLSRLDLEAGGKRIL
jgi:hypothetical protein